MSRRVRVIATVLTLVALACGLLLLRTAGQATAPPSPSARTGPGTAVPSTTPQRQRAEPWPQRPVVRLRFEVAGGRSRVDGQESVRFIPDLRVCELVFRSWPNKPETARAGNALTVTAVAVNGHAVRPRVAGAGALAGSPGTLVEVPLPACVPAGTSISADLRFQLTLGPDTPERVGYSAAGGMEWFGTAFPLLAWERERGWARDPAVDVFGEMATSEEFQLQSMEVVAPAADKVLGTGELVEEIAGAAGTTVHRFRARTVRDVAVTIGALRVVERTVDGVRLHVGGPAKGTAAPLERWADLTAGAVRKLAALLGPYPHTDLWVTIVPGVPTGIEFPGAIQFSDVDPAGFRSLVSHEVAHMWLYGLVGNDQARNPWLDESFATWAQAVVDGDEGTYQLASVPADVVGMVGRPMTFWARRRADYGPGVYQQGGAALIAARQLVGSARFDAAMRAYVDINAHQVATPDDVERAFAGLPEVLKILRRVGALN
jgi:hypothetical protein